MPLLRFATSRRRRSILEHGLSHYQPAGPSPRWTVFMAVLWSGRPFGFSGSSRRALLRTALGLMLVILPVCSELAQPSDTMPSGAEPPYVSLAAKYLQSVMKDRASYDAFEISGLRWVHVDPGLEPGWPACTSAITGTCAATRFSSRTMPSSTGDLPSRRTPATANLYAARSGDGCTRAADGAGTTLPLLLRIRPPAALPAPGRPRKQPD